MSLPPRTREYARTLVAERLGLDFGGRREADLERGLLRACRAAAARTPEQFLARLGELPAAAPEWKRLASHLTVGETYFFRDEPFFTALEHEVLPRLVAERRESGHLRLRIWSAACATGEEPYSVAILLDRLLPDIQDWALTLLATDVDPDALAAAAHGSFRRWSLRATPPGIERRYFQGLRQERWELDPRIRAMVTFAPLNLAEETYPSHATNTVAFDLVLCRNVLMYLTRDVQRAAVARLTRTLVPGGWLAVSPAEASPDLLRPLEPVAFAGTTLFRKEAVPRPSLERAEPALAVRRPSRTRRAEPPPPLPTEAPPPEHAAALLERARLEAGLGNLEEARRLCEEAVARDRLDATAYLLLAAVCHEAADEPAALEALRAAIYLAPDAAAAHFLLAGILRRRGGEGSARRSMEQVVRLLTGVPPDEPVPGTDGIPAGRMLETATVYLERS